MRKTLPPTLTHLQYFVLRAIESLGNLASFDRLRKHVNEALALRERSPSCFRVIIDAMIHRKWITIDPGDPLARSKITEAGHEALQYSCLFYSIKEGPCQKKNSKVR